VKLKVVATIFAFFAVPAFAFGQQGSSAPKAPKPTKADAQKVAQIISGDNAKLQAYCDSKKLYDQMAAAYKKNDSKTADALNKQADALAEKIGPEYSKMMDGLEQVDQKSSEAKEFMAILSGLDKLCSGPALAQPTQPQRAPAQPIQAQPAPAQPTQAQPTPAQPAPGQPASVQSGSDEASPPRPCAQIRAACTQAGFVPNGVNMGIGIIVDCIRPIMTGAPQRKLAAKPLPQIDPQVVVACKNRNPNFGGGANMQPGRQPNPSNTMESPDQ
jgi:hypothetical protein